MSPLAIAFSSIFPLFIYMFLGATVKRVGWTSEKTLSQLNLLVFKVFLPILLFTNIYNSDLASLPGALPIIYPIIFLLILFLLCWVVVHRFHLPGRQKGVIIQACYRSNFVLFGLPLSLAISQGKTSGLTEVLIAIIIPLINVMAVVILSYYGEQQVRIGRMLLNILKNPLIIASILAILVKVLNLPLPDQLVDVLKKLGGIATPLSLIVLGGQFRFSDTSLYIKQLIFTCLMRLVIVPVAGIGIAIALDMRGEPLITYIALFGSPVAVSSFTMAAQMKADDALAGQILVYTSAFCLLTLFGIIYALKVLALI